MALQFGKVPQFGYIERPIIKPEGKGWNNLGKRDILGVVLHRMLGSLWGTDSYFRFDYVNALTDYGIGVAATDGTANAGVILKWNDPWGYRSGWASGPVSAPYGDGATFVAKYGINAVNRRLVSLEISGNQTTPIDNDSFAEIVHFIAFHADQAGISWQEFPYYKVTGMSFLFYHDEFCFGSGKRCPFEVVKSLINTIVAAVKSVLRRYQETAVSVPTDPILVDDTGLKVGAWVVFDGVYNVRRAYTVADTYNGQPNVTSQTKEGMKAKIINGPNINDNYTWWDVEIPGVGTGHVIGDGMTVTTAPAPAPEPEKMWKSPAPVKELALADPDTFGDLTLANGTKFRPVFDTMEAVRQGKQRRFAVDGENVDVIGPDYKPGDRFEALCRFTNDQGTEYLYLSNHARVYFNDFKRVKD